ncbi:hypothetical protein TARUN_2126 [Trichoderma arundinaceum]|uniref:Uncharacterized protein n=1 Tax=Trichoderma arundinaceum TaxID=490622 RepID=A0A395NVK2_TRIAR|nr:hypothetical protein TARUN_2126 [Trichoderma arundinaceum]
MADLVNVTPKRKRGADVSFSPLKFSFDLSATGPPEDGGNSPRSSTVVHRFRGLALGSGGGAVEAADEMDVESDASVRKRHKPDGDAHTAVQVQPQPRPQLGPQPEPGPEMETVALVEMTDRSVPQLDVPPPSAEGLLQEAYPSIDGLSESQSRKKRAGTPPLRFKKGHPQEGLSDADDEAEVVDPLRASLTWHEDEITIYDPNDKDDDGTGINGVGFKPTPAIAHARVMKRRQQMAEYRKREENEARNRRSQRRRGEIAASARRDHKSPPSRRVRFMDGESRNLTMMA